MNTKEVVINSCFGGFSLSDEAFELYLTKKGIKFYKEREYDVITHYYTVPPEKYKRLSEKWHREDGNFGRINDKGWYLSDRNIKRDDPILLEVVKELGDKANGRCAKLKIVKIPTDVEYVIDEYDGSESIHEEHRSWS